MRKNICYSIILSLSKLALEQLRAFISIENVATFDHLPSGIDPETLGWSYPAFRTVSFGINFTLPYRFIRNKLYLIMKN